MAPQAARSAKPSRSHASAHRTGFEIADRTAAQAARGYLKENISRLDVAVLWKGKLIQASDSNEPVGWERTLKQAFELWITPEFERRKSAGLINSNFRLESAQVLFSDDGANNVRFNEEVRGLLQVRAARAVQKGQAVVADDIADYVGMDLLEEDRNFGHFTLIQHHDKWVILFDFNRNKHHASELVALAEEFTNVAAYCFTKSYFRPFIDNLFSGCELLAKARLITTVLKRDGTHTHGHIHSTINSWRKLGM